MVEDRELVEVENLLVCVGAVGMIGVTVFPATGRDFQCRANEIADSPIPLHSRHAMVHKVAILGGAEDLDLELVSTLGTDYSGRTLPKCWA